MTHYITTLEQIRDEQFEKHIIACRQLGAYGALLDYAIKALKGATATSPEGVAEYLEGKQVELINEQDVKLFKRA